ncbi:hypothetical protein PENSPDRAFT_665731 [Peniophora sp. CONT]|nr:hypothetical protein PENSPDRAFT_665731 [Peniophora sp. CONT]
MLSEVLCVPIVCASASLTLEDRTELFEHLSDDGGLNFRVIAGSLDRPNIFYSAHPVHSVHLSPKFQAIQQFIARWNLTESSGLVYCSTRAHCDKVAEFLNKEYGVGFAGVIYSHDNLPNHIRKANVRDWMEGKLQVLVATIAFGLGIDKLGEVGRAGRDGKKAYCLLSNPRPSLVYSWRDVQRSLFYNTVEHPVTAPSEAKPTLISKAAIDKKIHTIGIAVTPEEDKMCGNQCDNCLYRSYIRTQNVTGIAKSLVEIFANDNFKTKSLGSIVENSRSKAEVTKSVEATLDALLVHDILRAWPPPDKRGNLATEWSIHLLFENGPRELDQFSLLEGGEFILRSFTEAAESASMALSDSEASGDVVTPGMHGHQSQSGSVTTPRDARHMDGSSSEEPLARSVATRTRRVNTQAGHIVTPSRGQGLSEKARGKLPARTPVSRLASSPSSEELFVTQFQTISAGQNVAAEGPQVQAMSEKARGKRPVRGIASQATHAPAWSGQLTSLELYAESLSSKPRNLPVSTAFAASMSVAPSPVVPPPSPPSAVFQPRSLSPIGSLSPSLHLSDAAPKTSRKRARRAIIETDSESDSDSHTPALRRSERAHSGRRMNKRVNYVMDKLSDEDSTSSEDGDVEDEYQPKQCHRMKAESKRGAMRTPFVRPVVPSSNVGSSESDSRHAFKPVTPVSPSRFAAIPFSSSSRDRAPVASSSRRELTPVAFTSHAPAVPELHETTITFSASIDHDMEDDPGALVAHLGLNELSAKATIIFNRLFKARQSIYAQLAPQPESAEGVLSNDALVKLAHEGAFLRALERWGEPDWETKGVYSGYFLAAL